MRNKRISLVMIAGWYGMMKNHAGGSASEELRRHMIINIYPRPPTITGFYEH